MSFDVDARAGDGTTLEMGVLGDGPAELSSGELAPGQTAKGALVFKLGKASKKGAVITYSPGFDELACWTVA